MLTVIVSGDEQLTLTLKKYTLLFFIVYLHEINNLQHFSCEFHHLTLNVHFISMIFHCLLIKLTDKCSC